VAQKFTVPITVKQLASAGSDAVTVYVDQDTYSRLKVEAGGRLTWGSGAAAGDVNLYRDSADVLKTDDTFKAPSLFVDNIEIDPTGAVTNDALVFNGVKFVSASVAGGGGGASLTVSDVAPTSPSEGDLWFNSSNARTYVYYDSSWVEVGGSGGVASLDDIGDVSASAAISGDLIQYNGSAWVNVPSSTVGATTLDGLGDVVVTSPLQFQGLMYDGTNWVNSSIPDVYLVRNNTGSTILKGTLVGAVGAEPSGRIDVAPFEVTGTENSELRAMGIAASNISNGVNGEVMSFGTLTGLDTRGSTASSLAVGDETWAAGDILFAHPTVAGKLTNVRPQHDLAVAFITVRHASTGQIAIRIIPGNNHLEWMHDVSLVDKTSGDFLKYNGTLWVNDQINLGTDTVGNYMSNVSASTGINISHTQSEGSTATIALNATLDDLSNVSVATPNTNDVLTYNGSAWTSASASGGGASVTVSETPPASPSSGDLWFESDTTRTYVYYDSFWVEVGAAGMAAIAADAAPASPVTGQLWFNTSTGGTYVYYDSAWIEVGAVAANTVFNLVDAKGDLLVGTADNTLARQAVGTNGQLLQANSSATNGVEWITPTYAPAAGPTFTGTVVLPSTTSIGTVSSTEIGYVDGVTSAIQTQLDSKLTTTTAVTSNRNKIINGSMDVWQRGTSFTTDAAATNIYTADRWVARALYPGFGATQTITRESTNVPTGFIYSLKSVVSTAVPQNNARMQIGYTMENADALKYAGKTMVVSFQAKAIGNINIVYAGANYNTSGGRVLDGTNIVQVTPTINTSSFTTCTFTFTVPSAATLTSAGTLGIYFVYSRSSGTEQVGDGMYLGAVQMEVGSTVTPFEVEDVVTTLAKCRRYYYQSVGTMYFPATTTFGNSYGPRIWYPVPMRTSSATATVYGNANQSGTANKLTAYTSGGGSSGEVTINIEANSSDGFQPVALGASTYTLFTGSYKVENEL
jgi:hypothetical protein